jgi:hypothetical protein
MKAVGFSLIVCGFVSGWMIGMMVLLSAALQVVR